MPDPLTMASVGAFVGNAAASFAINVASSYYTNVHKPWDGYKNHDIPRCVAKAWQRAIASVCSSYLRDHRGDLTEADRMAIESASADLGGDDVAKAMFLREQDGDRGWAADLSRSPLDVLGSPSARREASAKLVKMIRDYAASKELLSKVPETFYQACEDNLFTAVAYFYVEIAIKEDSNARSQIMYEIAQEMWQQLREMRREQRQQVEGLHAHIDQVEDAVRRAGEREASLIDANASLVENNSSLAQSLAGFAAADGRHADELASTRAKLQEIQNAYRLLANERFRAGRTADEIIVELRETGYEQLEDAIEEEASNATTEARRVVERAVGLHRAVVLLVYPRGEIDRAERALREWLALTPNDPDGINRLGHLQLLRGRVDEAATQYRRVLDAADQLQTRAVALGNLGLIEKTRGNLDAAEDYHKRSLAINEELGRKEGVANQRGNLGLIEMTRGNLDAAEDYLKRSLKIDQELGRKEGVAVTLGNLGVIERTRGNLDAAEDYHKQSLKIEEELGRKEGVANQLGNLGLIEQTRGNLDAAEDYYMRSLAIDEELGRKEGLAATLGNLGLIEQTRGNLDAAEDYYMRSLAIDEELGQKEGMANQLGNLGGIEMTRGNLEAARSLWVRSRDLFAEIGMPHMIEQVQGLIDGLGDAT